MPADFTLFIQPNLEEPWMPQINKYIQELVSKGSTFFRLTSFDDDLHSFSLEGWKTEPKDQGPEPKLEDFIGFGKQDNI